MCIQFYGTLAVRPFINLGGMQWNSSFRHFKRPLGGVYWS